MNSSLEFRMDPVPALEPASGRLGHALTNVFGFRAFRAGQERVCHAVFEGQDALVVMPTGSGKSLCYQLPAVARGGTAVIISPLIALMEDQVAKLQQRGLSADRVHSGRTREASRAAAIAYRDGRLQFLFIAPERFSVPGFPEFLARRKPSLIAVDEAHCISQWGHDFRPDYRMLQRYLPLLRPAPIIALTATATPVVQNDIVQQLGLNRPLRSIQGFRRHNIAIEVVEISPSARGKAVIDTLRDAALRPAIVYVPTRKESDSLAADLSSEFRTEPYHAGLISARRQQVQERFLCGEVDVIVATIAFGMGIDKPNIRTVIHTALPGSVEAYYQEIGRAGRDGAPSRAILMHSYADRHRHDFFFDRDYPDVEVLDGIYQRLGLEPITKEELLRVSRLDSELFEKSLEKLWVHGGAAINPEETIARGEAKWRASYLRQVGYRAAQLDLMIHYAAADHCRMAALVHHFGDRTDAKAACGICDFCAAEKCLVQRFRDATSAENSVALAILDALAGGIEKPTGKLYNEICSSGEIHRDAFEELLGAMCRGGFIVLTPAVLEKEGRKISYRRARLTQKGATFDRNTALHSRLRQSEREPRAGKAAQLRFKKRAKAREAATGEIVDGPLAQALRDWRLREAKSRSVPAFRIFTDKILRQIVEDQPALEEDLLSIPGIGLSFAKRYGARILEIVRTLA